MAPSHPPASRTGMPSISPVSSPSRSTHAVSPLSNQNPFALAADSSDEGDAGLDKAGSAGQVTNGTSLPSTPAVAPLAVSSSAPASSADTRSNGRSTRNLTSARKTPHRGPERKVTFQHATQYARPLQAQIVDVPAPRNHHRRQQPAAPRPRVAPAPAPAGAATEFVDIPLQHNMRSTMRGAGGSRPPRPLPPPTSARMAPATSSSSSSTTTTAAAPASRDPPTSNPFSIAPLTTAEPGLGAPDIGRVFGKKGRKPQASYSVSPRGWWIVVFMMFLVLLLLIVHMAQMPKLIGDAVKKAQESA